MEEALIQRSIDGYAECVKFHFDDTYVNEYRHYELFI